MGELKMNKKVEVNLDDTFDEDIVRVEVPKTVSKKVSKVKESLDNKEEGVVINCLRNERITVKHVPKENGFIKDPKHIAYGGMIEGAARWFTVPTLSSGTYVNVLTNSEKAFLEDVLGLEDNALSIYNKKDNFWDDFTVRLTKEDTYLNLSDPTDYIKYKVLLANKEFIAPSIEYMENYPKATYQFVLISEGDSAKSIKKKTNTNMQAYMLFGKIQEDKNKLRVIIETIESKPSAPNTKLEFLQEKIGRIIQADAKLFLKVASDPMLDTKVLIKLCIEKGIISNRGGLLYLKDSGMPLCGDNQDPTITVAANFLNLPKNQELLFSLQAKIKD